jgi:hypothetical protein
MASEQADLLQRAGNASSGAAANIASTNAMLEPRRRSKLSALVRHDGCHRCAARDGQDATNKDPRRSARSFSLLGA